MRSPVAIVNMRKHCLLPLLAPLVVHLTIVGEVNVTTGIAALEIPRLRQHRVQVCSYGMFYGC